MTSYTAGEWIGPAGYVHQPPRRTAVTPAWDRPQAPSTAHDHLLEILAGQIEMLLEKSETPWRALQSMADELGTDEIVLRDAIDRMGDRVRRPVSPRGDEVNWYRLASKSYTWQEHWRVLRAILGRTAQ